MNNNKNEDRDFGVQLLIFVFRFGDWFEDKLHWGDSYTYHSAEIYVSKSGLITPTNLQSNSSNIRQHCRSGKWQIKHADKETGMPRWEDLTQSEVEITIEPALAKQQAPVFNFCM